MKRLLLLSTLVLFPIACDVQPVDNTPDNNGGDTGGDGAGDGDGNNSGASGGYDPATGLQLQSGDLTLTIPPNAADAGVTISARAAEASDLPAGLPAGIGLAGGVFSPDGQTFHLPAQVTVKLPTATIAGMLPVLTFDTASDSWVGTGAMADVASNGLDASFPLDHFSIAGIPTPIPIPDPGDEIGSFVVVSNNGTLSSDAISSDAAAMLFSEFGDTFSLSATSQKLNMQGQLVTKAIGLSAILVTHVDNYLVGVVGGGASLFNAGMLNEPALGVMIMSVSGSTVNISFFVATPQRVIQGTLTGPAA